MGDFTLSTEILLATYNGERYLPDLLSSLAEQTERKFIVRIQDDGSEDSTPDIIAQWAADDARFIITEGQKKHLGAKGNFCSLLSESQADRVLLCDQDDIWEKGKVQKLTEACEEAEKHLEPGTPVLVHSDASLIDEKGCFLGQSFFRQQGWDPEATQLNRLLVQNNATGCTMILNRALAKLVASFGNPETMFMHDWFIALTAASFGQIQFVNEPMTRYRQHGDNTIGASRNSLLMRGMQSLREKEKARARIALTYSNAESFKQAYGSCLPQHAREIIDNYLDTRSMPKLRRIHALYAQGYLMQNPVTRLGQVLFG